MTDNLPDEEVQQKLKSVIDYFDQEDRAVRDRQLRLWKRMKLYWDGFERVWYSETAHDWRIHDDVQTDNEMHHDYYDKPVNVFKAYLETIIAALSVTIPPVRCVPDDPDNPLDKSTAKAGNKISELIYKQQDAPLKWVHALYVYCTEGLVACYNHTITDKRFGTYKKDEYETVEEDHYVCPECEEQVDEVFSEGFDGDEVCPECGTSISLDMEPAKLEITRLVGTTDEPKSRQILDINGGLYVKVPNYAISQDQCPYLFYSYETNWVNIAEEYEHLRDIKDWRDKTGYDSGGVYDPYERWARLNPQYRGEYPLNVVTKRQCWLRPSAFNILQEDDAEMLKKKYPDGVKVILANEEFCHACEENLDDHWTLTKNPLSDYLHHDPLGLLLTSIQDITNELVSLTLQTIEHGIPQTFADPSVLNFNEYGQTEVAPGTIYPAKPAAGKSVGEGFYEIKTSTLSREVLPFATKIQEMGQLVVGALPSLFGGAAKSGSNTAAEYQMSRAQALQRLQTPWKMLTAWWEDIFGKVIPAYLESVEDDERFVTQDKNGNYINVFLTKAEMQGKIGSVELEANETLPISWTQKKDVIMQLMELQIPSVMEALTSPENLPFIKEAVGLDEFIIPGEADRQKQYEEINLLLESEPFMDPTGVDPMTGQPIEQEVPSVEIEPDIDNHQVQADICRTWLISEAGQLAKEKNPKGYMNVLLHMKMHLQFMQQQMAQVEQVPPEAAPEGPSPDEAAQQGEFNGLYS